MFLPRTMLLPLPAFIATPPIINFQLFFKTKFSLFSPYLQELPFYSRLDCYGR